MIHRYVATVGERRFDVTVEAAEGAYRVSVDGRVRMLDARRVEARTWSLLQAGGGAARLVDVDGRGSELVVGAGGISLPVQLVEGRQAAAANVTRPARSGPQPIRAPMPGKVVKLLATVGEAVKSGQGVMVIEAMKMENELKAPRDGTVLTIAVKEGQPVESGQVLATIE
jgi:biotin carboxyl carrier protein